jgi:translation initiation factor IF-2
LTKDDNKDKLRVYEYAKNLNMSSKEIITILKRLNLPVNNHMSVMENEAVDAVEKFFRDIKSNAAAKRAASENAQRPQPQIAQGGQQQQGQRSQPQAAQGGQQQQGQRPQPQAAQGGQQQQGQRPQPQASQGSEQQQGQRPQPQAAQGGQQQQGQRPQGSQGGQYQGQRPQGSQSDRPQGQRPQGSQGGQYQGQRPQGAQGGQQQGQRGPRTGGVPSSAQGTQRAKPAGDAGVSRAPQDNNRGRTGDSQRRYNEGPNRGPSGGPRNFSTTTRNPIVSPVNVDPDTKAGQDKLTKKNRRFDDNRTTGFRSGQPNRNQKNAKGKQQQVPAPKKDNTPKKVIVRGSMTVGELAKLLHKDVSEVIKKLFLNGIMATINQELDLDTVQLLVSDYGVEIEVKIAVDDTNFETFEEIDEDVNLIERPPVVTIMGHVDHGKTTLLDAIRHTNVTEGEAGGITQHIGAYQVETNGKKITFLDTPGHEAFTSMRARGAQVTDITIIVVAADDGVMPQTVEAINHAKAANVPIIVAVNKIDKPDANPDKIKQELTEYALVPEEWGGDTIFCNISAKQRMGLDNLLDMILLVAEVQELRANPNKRARGTVIEAELDKGKGPVARVLIQNGTLKVGDSFIAGVYFGRVRAMVNDKGKRLKEAGPSTPVEITGLTEVPQAGDPLLAYEDERKAREVAERRAVQLRQSEFGQNSRVTLDDLYKHIKDGEIKDLNVIIKADVQGSVEALKGSLAKIEVAGVRVKIIHQGAGAITESDITLASASNAIVIGFNVRPEPAAQATAEHEKVDIRLHRIIYNVISEIESAMKGMLDPIFKETIIGQAEVRNTFKVTKVGTIAGCMVTTGKVTRSANARVIRAGIVVFEGKIDNLKRFKDDAKEVSQGYECGITLERFQDIKEGDLIEAYIMESVER